MIQSAKPLAGTKFCLAFFLIQKRHKINQEKYKISERLTLFTKLIKWVRESSVVFCLQFHLSYQQVPTVATVRAHRLSMQLIFHLQQFPVNNQLRSQEQFPLLLPAG